MPNYDFQCKNPDCGKTEQRLVKMSEESSQVCSCGFPMERQYTVGSLKFLFNYFEDE